MRLSTLVYCCAMLAANAPDKQPELLPPPAEVSIEGYYTVKGTDANGDDYVGMAVIRRVASGYRVAWLLDNGDTLEGAGIKEGRTFSVGWAIPRMLGVSRFEIQATEDGKAKLVGRWVVMPAGAGGEEVLTWLKR